MIDYRRKAKKLHTQRFSFFLLRTKSNIRATKGAAAVAAIAVAAAVATAAVAAVFCCCCFFLLLLLASLKTDFSAKLT